MLQHYQELQYLGTEPIEIINTVSFNWDRTCIALATNKGFKILSTEPLRLKQHRDLGAPLQFVEMYERSNLLAFVGFENSAFLSNRVAIFDDNQNAIIADTTFESNVLSVKIRLGKMAVALSNKIFLLDFFSLEVQYVLPTLTFPESEPYNLISMNNDISNMVLCCPSLDLGQMLIVHLEDERQRHVLAHQSNINNIELSLYGDKVATSSEKGHNIRIFNTSTGEMIQQVRRGNQYGQIYSLAFSRGGNWLACTSDSNLIHVFAAVQTQQDKEMRYTAEQKTYNNPKSKLYFLRKIFPLFDAEYSFCYFKNSDFEPQMQCFASFGFHDDNLLIIDDYGTFKRIPLNLKGGLCTEQLQAAELLDLKIEQKK